MPANPLGQLQLVCSLQRIQLGQTQFILPRAVFRMEAFEFDSCRIQAFRIGLQKIRGFTEGFQGIGIELVFPAGKVEFLFQSDFQLKLETVL